jgi:UDP-N-acetylmuramoyl-L-alanyl-D-glutamate--2,6-diaminopimelate ligase
VRLSRLLEDAGIGQRPGVDSLVTGVAYDSRSIRPGELFVAVGGFHVDGADFVVDAFERGAVAAVLTEQAAARMPSWVARYGRPLIPVSDTRIALASLAATWYRHPAERLRTIGVTGTDGKTTTCYLIESVLEAGGLRTGLFTTVACKAGDRWEENESRQTTPEALEVQEILRRIVDGGAAYAVLESTSHGLELHKLDHCEYDIAVLTNVTPDHLDFHGTFEAYRAAKGRLFAMLDHAADKGTAKTAILNVDDPSWSYMAGRTTAGRLTYAIESEADVRPLSLDLRADGARLELATPAGSVTLELRLPGRFNVYNALAAAAVGVSQGVRLDRIASGLSSANGVPGRMQRIDAGQPFTVVVDYAHTAASFRTVLATLRPLTTGRLMVVFGCAGERGSERRSGMGSVAAAGADYAVLTSEDPRGEDPAAIVDEIARSMEAAGAREGVRFERRIDRKEAIARVFELAGPGDLVLLTGKGHEHSIETAAGRVPWDESAVARQLLGTLHGSND